MTIQYSPFYTSGDISFNVPFKKLYYQVNVHFFPFASNKNELERTELEKIFTPIAHIEFKVLEIEKSIYQSFFLMSAQALHIIENLGDCNINQITKIIAQEVGFEERITTYTKSIESKSQLSLF